MLLVIPYSDRAISDNCVLNCKMQIRLPTSNTRNGNFKSTLDSWLVEFIFVDVVSIKKELVFSDDELTES